MAHGFLGYNATFMLDAVVCALVFVVPVLAYSIYLVRVRRNYARHRQLQIFLAAVLLATVLAFEIDVQIVHGGWENIVHVARPSLSAERLSSARAVLRVHLLFAVSTPLLWAITLGQALARFGNPPSPAGHSRLHRWMGWASAVDLALTSSTGLAFYYAAFIA